MGEDAPANDGDPLVMRVGLLAERMLLDRAELADSLYLAYVHGASLRSLAEAARMSHEQVRRIVHERQVEHRRRAPSLSHFVTM